MTDFTAIEPRIAIACGGIAVAIALPAWGSMHHPGESYELGLSIAAFFAVLGTAFGTITVYDGEWNFPALLFYLPWIVFGASACVVLVTGAAKSPSLAWQTGLALAAAVQIMAIFIPVFAWFAQNRRAGK